MVGPLHRFFVDATKKFSAPIYTEESHRQLNIFLTFQKFLKDNKKIQTCIFVSVIKSVVRRRWSGH